MDANKICERIKNAKEFVVDRESLEGLESTVLEREEEYRRVIDALITSFWKLPKNQQQEEWAALLVEKIEKREDGLAFARIIMDRLKSVWLDIGIRRNKKFVMLLDKLVEWMCQKKQAPFEEFIVKGPDALYDTTVMKRVVETRDKLSKEEMLYLVKYLIENPDTYFRRFFTIVVLPKMQQQEICPTIIDLAYTHGSKKKCSATMREALYSICSIGDTSPSIQNIL